MTIVHTIRGYMYIIQHSKPSTILRPIFLFIIMKLFIAVLISLCLSFSNAQRIINNTATVPTAIETDLCLCNLNVPVLNEFIDNRISATLADQLSLCNLNVPLLNEFIDKRIAAVLDNQPSKYLHISV